MTSHYLTVQKVMTIAAPYNLNDSSVRSETELLENLIANRKYIPNSIDMYSLAGTQSYSNDGLVPLYSVLAGRYIYQKQVKHYKIQRNSVTEPIVLVPGSNATQYRFDPLIRDINKREKTPHSLL
ncbi:hypothetical protein WP50_35215, partial [Lactiplantibacillus plantarum]